MNEKNRDIFLWQYVKLKKHVKKLVPYKKMDKINVIFSSVVIYKSISSFVIQKSGLPRRYYGN